MGTQEEEEEEEKKKKNKKKKKKKGSTLRTCHLPSHPEGGLKQ